MSNKTLTVSEIRLVGNGQVQVKVQVPPDLDLQHIYRSAISIYWNPESSSLEDHWEKEEKAEASFARVQNALLGEYRIRLIPSGSIVWTGFSATQQEAVQSCWNG